MVVTICKGNLSSRRVLPRSHLPTLVPGSVIPGSQRELPIGGFQAPQFTAGTVDFGASDKPMKDEAIAKVSRGVVQIPMTAGAIAVAYNNPS